MGFLWAVFSFLLVLTPIIIIHELGHFWAARLFGIKVEEFGIGFPPRAATLFTSKGTRFTLNWIPIGGFVRPAGENNPDVPGGLASASKTARFSVLVAGSTFNFILAFLILWGLFMIGPEAYDSGRIVVGEVMNGAAMEAGILAGDEILAIDGTRIDGDSGIATEIVQANPEKALEMEVLRDGVVQFITVTPALIEVEHNGELLDVGRVNLRWGNPPTGERQRMAAGPAARESYDTIYQLIALTLSAPGKWLNGELSSEEVRPVSVVGMSQIIGQEAQTGQIYNVMFSNTYHNRENNIYRKRVCPEHLLWETASWE